MLLDPFYYRSQTKFAKVMFLQVSVCPHGGGACVVAGGWVCVVALGGHVWLLRGGMHGSWGGACMVAPGGVHGFFGGACMVFSGGAWFFPGGMRGFFWGACVVFSGGACVVFSRGGMHRIGRDMVNEREVRILLECILVSE